jgi:ferredoxin
MKPLRLQVDPLTCRAHGLCAEELPETIRLDEWGYPILDGGSIAPPLIRRARAAANACPVLALRLSPVAR